MNITTKLLALITCLFILCGCFVSCKKDQQNDGENNNVNEETGGENNSGDTEEPEETSDSYTVTVKTVYETKDAKMKDAIAAIGSPTTTISFDGDNIKVDSFATVNDITTKTDYVYIDGVIYYANEISVGELFLSEYKKANMNAEQKSQLLSDVGAGANISKEDFSQSNTEPHGYSIIYTCTGISSDAKESLCNIFASKFEAIGATVKLSDVTYCFETIKGEITSSKISCNFVINMGGEEYKVTMHLNYEYNYDAEVSISAPRDAEEYLDASLEEILG